MLTVAERHQKQIARQTLKMTPAAARIMGGMTYAQAYKIIFGRDLAERAAELLRLYPEPCDLCFELNKYGWKWSDLPELSKEKE
jgi:hypothetical protein